MMRVDTAIKRKVWSAQGHSENGFMRGVVAATAIGLALGVAVGLLGWSSADREASVVSAAAELASGPVGAHYPLVDLNVAPFSVTKGPGGAYDLVFEVSMGSRYEDKAAFQMVYIFVDDSGQAVTRPINGGVVVLEGPAERVSTDVRVPAHLRDGYYMLRVTAAGSDGHDDAVVESQQYLRIRRGQILPVSEEEWHTRSKAMQARAE